MVGRGQFLIQPAFAEAASRRQVAVSRLRGRSRYGAAKVRLDQKKNLPQRSLRLSGENIILLEGCVYAERAGD
jgi:hypothetical protein